MLELTKTILRKKVKTNETYHESLFRIQTHITQMYKGIYYMMISHYS